MQANTLKHFLSNLTSPGVAALNKESALVVLPLASVEQHGAHLPVFTDSIICMEVLERALALLPDESPVWVLPLLPFGKSNEHAGFPGTLTLTATTLMTVLMEIARSVARTGFKRFAILNAHGGNSEVVDFVIRDIREETGMLVFGLHVFLRIAPPKDGLSTAEQVYGIHAGDVETSVLLACQPGLVQRHLAPSSLPLHLEKNSTPPFLGPLNYAWLMRDISPGGVLGDATTADPERGSKYLADGAREVADLFSKAMTFSF